MAAARGRVCALGVVLVLASGCASDYLRLAFAQNVTGPNQVIVGSVESVTRDTQAALSRIGVNAVTTQEGEGVRITGTSPRGTTFSLLLTQVHDQDSSERTRIRIEWKDTADKELGLLVLSQIGGSSSR